MVEGWKGTYEDAANKADSGTLLAELSSGYQTAYGRPPGPQELAAWSESLPPFLESVDSLLPPDLGVVLEYKLPFNGQRIDLLLLGADDQGGNSAVVVELKSWTASVASPDHDHFVVAGGREALHPSLQALGYAGKLRYFHSEAQRWTLSACVFLSKGTSANHPGLRDARFGSYLGDAPVYLSGDSHALETFVLSKVPKGPTGDAVQRFTQGAYTQSVELLDGLRKYQDAFFNRAETVLAYNGWGLSPEQYLAEDEILRQVAQVPKGEPVAFFVRGGPGSGKSLLGHRTFFQSLALGKKCVFAVRNNRLMYSLREILDPQYRGVRGALKYFSTKPHGTDGVEDAGTRMTDVLICDEAQRLRLDSSNLFSRASVTVCLYDDSQILNQEERGTQENLLRACRSVGVETVELELPTLHRCRGGGAYVDWINGLLSDPEKALGDRDAWQETYTFEVATSPDDLRARLATRRDHGHSVGLVASFTRASGRETRDRADLGKTRVPEAKPAIEWLMDPQRDYVPFWVGKESNRLEKCASIYGCQGFELDHAGVVWGNDLVIRNGRWSVGEPDSCYDRAPGCTPLATVMRDNPPDAMRLLTNRYRIFLTRGIQGTATYFEDEETRDFLSELGA